MTSPPSWAAFGLVARPTSATPSLVDAPGWSHYWRKGGPMLLAKLTSRWSHVAGGRHSHAADSGTLCVVADHTAVAQRASGLDRSEPTGRRQGAPRIGRLDFVRFGCRNGTSTSGRDAERGPRPGSAVDSVFCSSSGHCHRLTARGRKRLRGGTQLVTTPADRR